jgi:hypothetical protein
MLTLQKPTEDTLKDILLVQHDKDLSYSEVKATLLYKSKEEFQNDKKFKVYDIDYFKFTLGEGSTCYDRSVEALKHYKVRFPLSICSKENYLKFTPCFFKAFYVRLGNTLFLWRGTCL